MPPTPTPPEWTLSAKHTHGTFGQLLVGCHIIKNATNTGYQFTETSTSNVLANSPGTKLPTAPFTFTPAFNYNGLTGVVITMGTPVAAGTNWNGSWSCIDSPPPHGHPLPTGPQGGDFTAQAGGGFAEDPVANSAKA